MLVCTHMYMYIYNQVTESNNRYSFIKITRFGKFLNVEQSLHVQVHQNMTKMTKAWS